MGTIISYFMVLDLINGKRIPLISDFPTKRIYSRTRAFYFLTIGGNGKRIALSNPPPNANVLINSFDERYFHELDTINFLGSGKQWYGEELSSNPGKQTSITFPTGIPALITSSPLTIQSNCIARSVGSSSRFLIKVNGQQLLQLDVPATTATPTDPFAKSASGLGSSTVPAGSPLVQVDFVPGSFNAQARLKIGLNYLEEENCQWPMQVLCFSGIGIVWVMEI